MRWLRTLCSGMDSGPVGGGCGPGPSAIITGPGACVSGGLRWAERVECMQACGTGCWTRDGRGTKEAKVLRPAGRLSATGRVGPL